ncbi:MAG: hypothetical protein KDA65_16655 [Planctomycetaceae bacterium]|nr:hypothetical protein [Planctomycetaceae bacterium]
MRTNPFTLRRLRNSLLTGLVAIGLCWVTEVGRSRFYDVSFYLGYLLAGMILFLAAFNLRKKLTTFRVGTSAGWLQFHLYLGLLTPVVFGLHTSWAWPNGKFEQVLAGIYTVTFLSGVYGLYLTRKLPRFLTRLPVELIYEQYDQQFHSIKNEATSEIRASIGMSGDVSEKYVKRVIRFLSRRRTIFYYLWPTIYKRRRLINHLRSYHRYASAEEYARLERLEQLIARRDDYDFHHALQWKLRAWIFGHLALTWSMLALVLMHLVLVHLYRGSY